MTALNQFAHPPVVGAFLKEPNIEEIARVLYERFCSECNAGSDWKTGPQTRKIVINQVKRTLDAISVAGYKLVPMDPEEERAPHK